MKTNLKYIRFNNKMFILEHTKQFSITNNVITRNLPVPNHYYFIQDLKLKKKIMQKKIITFFTPIIRI